ncbi:restriction endonuclease subunit S, partial [uncultured Rummeliibacillus sp.]|uniref:restriction endonuclease subunit S n=1 Tax=uncultured Rummeliibacillus sp. TaxID=762292 RepID=UPI002610E20F
DDSVKKKVPELRFKGFTDDWEERKLGVHAKYRRGSFPQPYGNKEWYDGEGAMPFVQVVDVTNKLTLVENTKQKISKLAQSKSVFVPKGTVVVTLQGSIGRVAITQYDSFVDRTLLIFEDYEKETDERFWAYTIQKKFEIEKLKAPGGTIKTITKEALSSFDVHLPQFKEQAKIGSFFKQLDDTIALHQRKLDLLKEQKKGYLQKMFPKNGAKVPELRFAGFADDWEERKLGDISYKVKEKNKTGKFTETLTNSAEYGIINQRDFFDKDISNAKNLTGYYVVKNDDFVYNPRISNFAPVGPIKRNKLGRTGVMSPLYYVFRTHDIDKNYFEKYFDTVYWHRFMELNGDSGARADRFAIKDSVFVEMPIPYPTMDEQQKIGSFFKQLDNTITLHQRKLDLLKEQKKGFLQKMFV